MGSLKQAVESCETTDLHSLFGVKTAVLSGAPVDPTLVSAERIASLQASLSSAVRFLWEPALQNALKAGFGICYRTWAKTVSLVWTPLNPGLAPFILKAFTCHGHPGVHPLILEVPHPFYDRTREGLYFLFCQAIFTKGKKADLVCIQPTHRGLWLV